MMVNVEGVVVVCSETLSQAAFVQRKRKKSDIRTGLV
jgi:hypothetical protein